MKRKPPYLYRYLSLVGQKRLFAERLLVHDEVYFASPATFNDPFDCRVPRISSGGTPEEHRAYLEQTVPPQLAERKRHGAIEAMVQNGDLHDPARLEEFREGLQDRVNRIGVLCFVDKPDKILMWSHYADGHRGLCVQFWRPRASVLDRAVPVEYDAQYPPVRLIDGPEQVERIVVRKARCWRYEGEWRILMFGDGLDPGPGAHVVPSDSISGVVFGCNMTSDDRHLVSRWCSRRPHRPVLYEARPKDGEFGVDVRQVE